jgi:broad specificity phosphatase PhoE
VQDLLLVRHAVAGSNRDGLASCTTPGEGLTDEGRAQAVALRDVLREADLDVGVATDFTRTQETLALALGERNVPRIVVPALNEIHFGSYDGGSLEVYRGWAAAELPSTFAPGGGESRASAAARFARGARELLTRPEAHLLVVAHALVIRYLLDAAEGLVPSARITPVAHATPYPLVRADLERAATLLEEWSRAPAFRDPSIE